MLRKSQAADAAAADGVRLFFQKVGDGPVTLIIPNAFFMFDDFRGLADGRTLIFIDWRNRGRSDTAANPRALARGIQHDIDNLDAVRRHFQFERVTVIAHPYSTVTPVCVDWVVQFGAVQPYWGKVYPPHLTCADETFTNVMSGLQQHEAVHGEYSAVPAEPQSPRNRDCRSPRAGADNPWNTIHGFEDPELVFGSINSFLAGEWPATAREVVSVDAPLQQGAEKVPWEPKTVTVGMPVTRHPAYRSVHALLTHTAPISDVWRETAPWGKGAELPGQAETGR